MKKAAALLFLLLSSMTARAEDSDPAAEAKRQYNIGTQAYSGRRFVEAALAFEAAASYKPNAVTLYTAGLAWEQASQPERAADAFSRALELPGLLPQQQANAKDRVATFEKSLGTLVVTGPEGTKVQLDSLTETTLPARLHGQPGSHVLTARMPDAQPEKKDVVLEVGKATTVELAKPTVVQPPPKETPPLPPPPIVEKPAPKPATAPITRYIGFGLIGAGVALGASTLVLGLSASDAGDAYNARPSQAAYDHANALATWTNVAWITGAVLLAGGVTLVLIPAPKAQTALRVRPGGVSFEGMF